MAIGNTSKKMGAAVVAAVEGRKPLGIKKVRRYQKRRKSRRLEAVEQDWARWDAEAKLQGLTFSEFARRSLHGMCEVSEIRRQVFPEMSISSERRQRYKAQGLCRCGGKRVAGRTSCATCVARMQRRDKKRIHRMQRLQALQAERRAKGLCRACGTPAPLGVDGLPKSHCDGCWWRLHPDPGLAFRSMVAGGVKVPR